MSEAVFDASVLVPAVIDSKTTAAAAHCLEMYTCLTLDFAIPEVTNVIWQYVQAGEVPANDAEELLETVDALTTKSPADVHLSDALKLAIKHRHPVYDSLYVAYAISIERPLITADKRLARKFAGVIPAGIINLYDKIERPT